MPSLNLNVPHLLSQDQAVERLKEKFRTIKEVYKDQISSLEEQWDGSAASFSLATQGVTITGTVTIDPSDVKVHAKLPLAAMLFKSKIESKIRERLAEILAE